MSTVTPSTSNIERSSSFATKNTSTKTPGANQTANAFAALLMSVEDAETTVAPDASTPLADGTSGSTTANKGDAPESPMDVGQAALAGLLNWQALATADNAAQTATGNTASSATTLGIRVPPDQMTPSNVGKSAVESSVEVSQAALAGLLNWQALATADNAAQAATGNTASSAITPGIRVPPDQIAPSNIGKSAVNTSTYTVGSISPIGAPSTTSSPSQPVVTTPAIGNTASGFDLSDMTPTEEASLLAQATSPATLAPPQTTFEAMANGSERAGTAKARMGASRYQPSSGAAATKAMGSAALQSSTPNGNAMETDLLPRATVNLVTRSEQAPSSSTAEANAPAGDTALTQQDGPQLTTEAGTPSTEHVHASEHTPIAAVSTDPPLQTGVPADDMADIMDNLSGQIAYWAAQGSQKASLTVGDDKDNPLEVNISMKDGEVHIAFEAAQAEMRDALSLSAEDLLKNMLESKGMTLGDVTVGQRQASASQDQPSPDNRPNGGSDQALTQRAVSATQRNASTDGTTPSTPHHRSPSIATATKLDLFA